jgi:hypothetical protein
MIQRKQTLYMLVAVVCMTIFTFAKMFTFNAADSSMTLYTYGYSIQEMGAEPVNQLLNLRAVCMVLLAAISTLLMLVNIFLFKKRELQLSLLMSQYALLVGIIGYGVYYVWSFSSIYAESIADGSALTNVPGWSLCLPVVTLVMNFLAVRGVASDIALLRSVDRIR